MQKGSVGTKIILIMVIVTVIINIAVFGYLPDSIALQITAGGALANFVPKIVFAFTAPVILAIIYGLSSSSPIGQGVRYLFVAIIIFVINIVAIFANLRV